MSNDGLNGRVRAFCELGVKNKGDVIQVWRGFVGTTKPSSDDLIHTAPIDKDMDPERVVIAITEEADECAGRVRFMLKILSAGVERFRERLVVDGGRSLPAGVPPGGKLAGNVPGIGAPTTEIGVEQLYSMPPTDDPRINAAMGMAMVRQQMTHNERLVNHVVRLAESTHAPMMKQIETLSTALDATQKNLIESGAKHVAMVRETRILDAEAEAASRRAAAFEKTGEMLAKYLPGALARISRKYGIVAEDDENDPLLEQLVKSIKPAQFAKMQAILGPEQIALFADVWASMDGRQKERAAKKAKREGKKAPPAPSSEIVVKDNGPAAEKGAA